MKVIMYHEYESSDRACISQPPSVQGRLRSHSDYWLQELEPSSFVKEVITQGYRIPFVRLPDPVFYRNHNSALEHKEFVEKAIQELVATCCVEQCSQFSAVCSPLSVVVNARGKKQIQV